MNADPESQFGFEMCLCLLAARCLGPCGQTFPSAELMVLATLAASRLSPPGPRGPFDPSVSCLQISR